VRAEILLVGDELLEDHHGAQPEYLGELMVDLTSDLISCGYSLGRLTVVSDDPGELAPLLSEASQRGVDLVVTVGGLGPTHDDRVRDEVATILGEGPPGPHPDSMGWLVEAYESKGIPIPGRGHGWERMGHVPPGAEPLRNPVGMACGLTFLLGEGTRCICLPGVTYEALPMWRTMVVPELRRRDGTVPEMGEASLLVRDVREGLVAPIVEEFVSQRPSLRAGVYLMELVDGRFRAIRVTLRGDPGEVDVALPTLARVLGEIEGAVLEMPGGDEGDA
jgi:nicotinamide-nucleotide amidase